MKTVRSKLAAASLCVAAGGATLAPTDAHAFFSPGGLSIVSAPVLESITAAFSSNNAAQKALQLANDALVLANQAQMIYNQGQGLLNDIARIEQEALNLASSDLNDVVGFIERSELNRNARAEAARRVRVLNERAAEWFDERFGPPDELEEEAVMETAAERSDRQMEAFKDEHDALSAAVRRVGDLTAQEPNHEDRISEASRISQEAQGLLAAMQAQTQMTREAVVAIKRLEELELARMQVEAVQDAADLESKTMQAHAARSFMSDADREFTAVPAEVPSF